VSRERERGIPREPSIPPQVFLTFRSIERRVEANLKILRNVFR
jgi:hypothetical protein